jgi:uncharacterized protein
MKAIRLGIWLLAGWCGAVGAQSFDCKLAKTDVEKAVCASPELGKLDEAMAAKYKQMLVEVPPYMQTNLRTTQRIWLRGLPKVCKANVPQMSFTDCLRKQYKSQMDVLDSQVVKKGGTVFVIQGTEVTSKDGPDDPPSSKEIESNPGYGTLDASWPGALSKAPEWLAWNAAVLLETQKMAGREKEDTGTDWKDDWAAGAETQVTAKLVSVGAQRVSVAISRESDGHGAAHPNEDYEEFHWLLKEQRRLKVEDVFASPGWEAVVSARCRAALKVQVGDDYQSYAGSTAADFAKTLHGVAADPRNWDIDAKGLTINFPEYSVTPRAFPVDPVLVPWEALSGFLAKGFEVPR